MRDLGFTESTRFNEIVQRAPKFGLKLVSQDAALYMSFQMSEQVEHDEYFIFMTESIIDEDDDCFVFDLYRRSFDGVMLLDGVLNILEEPLDLNKRLVFARI